MTSTINHIERHTIKTEGTNKLLGGDLMIESRVYVNIRTKITNLNSINHLVNQHILEHLIRISLVAVKRKIKRGARRRHVMNPTRMQTMQTICLSRLLRRGTCFFIHGRCGCQILPLSPSLLFSCLHFLLFFLKKEIYMYYFLNFVIKYNNYFNFNYFFLLNCIRKYKKLVKTKIWINKSV